MRTSLRNGATALALLAGTGFALAQQPPAPAPAQQQPAGTPSQPPASPPSASQPAPAPAPQSESQAERAVQTESGKAGKDEPASHAPAAKPMDTAAFLNGVLAAPGASPDNQTAPAKFSARNAQLDELPVLARPLPITDEQRQRILAAISRSETSPADLSVQPEQILPSTVQLHELPPELSIASVEGLKYVRLADKIAFVSPANRIVVSVIAK